MTRHHRSSPDPTPPELADAPELAILAVVELALPVTVNALIAANPQLADAEPLANLPAAALLSWLADAIVSQAQELELSLARYRQLLKRTRQRPATDANNF